MSHARKRGLRDAPNRAPGTVGAEGGLGPAAALVPVTPRPAGRAVTNLHVRLAWVLVCLATTVLTAIAGVLWYVTEVQYATVRNNTPYELVWFAAQANQEFRRLQLVIAERPLPGTKVDDDEVGMRLDVVRNRVKAMGEGDFRRVMTSDGGLEAFIRDIDAGLDAVDGMIPQMGRPEVAERALAMVDRYEARLVEAVMAANRLSIAEGDANSTRLMDLHKRFMEVMVALLGCLAGIVALVGWHNVMLGRAARAQARLSAEVSLAGDAIRLQNDRFDAALNGMRQGLCLLSPEGVVLVHNWRFLEMFAPAAPPRRGATLRDVALEGGSRRLSSLLACEEASPGAERHDLEDGTSLAVHREPMPDGGMLITFDDVTDQRRSSERIAYLAHHDEMTGLHNRHYLNDLAGRMRWGAGGDAAAMLVLDLDGFKTVNDTRGHAAGDAVLREVGRRIARHASPRDVVARLGGDEFAVLHHLAGEGSAEVEALATALVEAIGRPCETSYGPMTVGVSVGVAMAPGDGDSLEDLMRNADQALYRAKSAGRGTVRFHDHEVDAARRERTALTADLEGATERGEFVLHFQPIVSAYTGRVVLREALLRWMHPTRGLLAPGRFIHLAEASGAIVPIGRWVLEEACRSAAAWPDEAGVAVNLSAVQMGENDIVGQVAEALRASGLPPARLEVEITETVLMQDGDETIALLEALKALGVRLSMDDFGTGYSSLSYLNKFAFDKIKVDQSFVRDVTGHGKAADIVASFTELAAKLNIVTTAEGVETAEQAEVLRRLGCDQLQGYFFGRPSPVVVEVGRGIPSAA